MREIATNSCGGLEIVIEVCVAMANSDEKVKYTELVNDHREEPVGENFRDYTGNLPACRHWSGGRFRL